jgi:hypothetical protein
MSVALASFLFNAPASPDYVMAENSSVVPPRPAPPRVSATDVSIDGAGRVAAKTGLESRACAWRTASEPALLTTV